MAFTARYNITSSNPTDLIAAGENAGNLRSILLTNVHSSNSISVDLFLYNASNYKTNYIIKNTAIPAGASLDLNVSNISINTAKNQDTLTIKCSSADGIDVIISK
jgi:hypothetical protein